MSSQRTVAILLSIAALVVLAVQLDYLLAGSAPQWDALVAASRFFSLVGNGAFLFSVAAAFFLWGAATADRGLRDTGTLGALSLLLSSASVHILKAAFERPRLSVAGAPDTMLHFLSEPSFFDLTGRYNSFPSGHTAASFALAYVLARRFPRYGVLFYLAAMLVAASRVSIGAHYPTDVLAGAFLGAVCGHLIMAGADARQKWLVAGLGLLVVTVSFFKTGGFLLFDVDEAVFSAAAREMVETGNFITPTYNYEPRYDKPILIYWLMGLAFKLFGATEFAARFTSGFFGIMLSAMTFLFTRRVAGLAPALLATLALVVNIEFFIYSHSAVTDMTLAFFITASLFSFYLADSSGDRRWYLGFWAASALAVLTKGAVGLLFPVAIALAYLLASGSIGRARALFKPSHIGLFIVISAPWFIAQLAINGWDFFNAFIVKHHIKRYTGVISSHSGPFYYYIGVLLLGFFPWMAMLPAGIYRAVKDRKDARAGVLLLSAVWFVFVLAFFSAARTKLPNYIFPLFPPAAILAGLTLSSFIEGWKTGRSGPWILAVVSTAFAGALFALPSFGLKMEIAFQPGFFYAAGSAFAAVAALSLASLFTRPLPPLLAIAGVTAALLVFLRMCALPPVNAHLQKTLYDYSRYARQSLPPSGVLAVYEINKPSIAFYSARKFIKADRSDSRGLREHSRNAPTLVIARASDYEELKGYDLAVLDSRDGYMLLGTAGLPPFGGR